MGIPIEIEQTVTAGNFVMDGAAFAVDTNIWLLGDDNEVLVVDAGHDATSINSAVDGREVVAIVCTHAHNDHCDSALELSDLTGAPTLLHPDDHDLWRRVNPGRWPDDVLFDGQVLTVAGAEVRVLHTPGHTKGSVSLYVPELTAVFTGDTLLSNGLGITGDRYSSATAIAGSVAGKLLSLPEETIVYAGHGDETAIGEARAMLAAS
jgi:glyoxylase-like metal-dependent hydrolase (beta-lactamase superfamily II)